MLKGFEKNDEYALKELLNEVDQCLVDASKFMELKHSNTKPALLSAYLIVDDLIKTSDKLSNANLALNPEQLASLISICDQAKIYSCKHAGNYTEESFTKYSKFIDRFVSALRQVVDSIPSEPVFLPRPTNEETGLTLEITKVSEMTDKQAKAIVSTLIADTETGTEAFISMRRRPARVKVKVNRAYQIKRPRSTAIVMPKNSIRFSETPAANSDLCEEPMDSLRLTYELWTKNNPENNIN